MRAIRAGGTAFVLLLIATSAAAEVRVAVQKDGTRLIYNVGGSGKSADWKWLARQHDRRTRYDPIIERYAEKFRVDPVLIRAVIQVESDFNPRCVSRKGARGLMQLIPATAKRYRVKDVFDPEENIRGGVHYLRDLLEMFPNNLPRALAAYNAGENAVARYRGIPPFRETELYVKRALTVFYGRPFEQALSFPARRGKPALRGGFRTGSERLAVAMMPGMKYLGTQ
jgi:soluble lytic murein transglycosylase-like protein